MALTEKRVLKSVEILNESNMANVVWEDQILRDGEVITAMPFRRSYSQADAELFQADLGDDAQKYLATLGWQ